MRFTVTLLFTLFKTKIVKICPHIGHIQGLFNVMGLRHICFLMAWNCPFHLRFLKHAPPKTLDSKLSVSEVVMMCSLSKTFNRTVQFEKEKIRYALFAGLPLFERQTWNQTMFWQLFQHHHLRISECFKVPILDWQAKRPNISRKSLSLPCRHSADMKKSI